MAFNPGWLGAVLALVLGFAARAAEAAPPGYALIWSEEFAGDPTPRAPDPRVWDFDLGDGGPRLPGWGNNELEVYTSSARNVFVQDGLLHLRAILDDPDRSDGRGPTSARLKTRPGVLPVHGYVEVRANLPCGKGAWPAVWMMGEHGVWPARGEIDLAEWMGRYFGPDEVQVALHTQAFHAGEARTAKVAVKSACGAFHIYHLEWTADALRLGVDGDGRNAALVYRRPDRATGDTWPFDQPFQLILNVAVGGTLGGPPAPSSGPGFEMLVDWVRVYRRP